MVSQELLKELQTIYREEYGIELTDSETEEAAASLLGYPDLLMLWQHEEGQNLVAG